MIGEICYNNSYKGTRPVNDWYNSFERAGKCADYTSRRGNSIVVSTISFAASGPLSFKDGRKFYFNDDFQINNSSIKAIQLVDTDQLNFLPAVPGQTQQLEIPSSQFKYGVLVVCDDCNYEICKIPLTMLSTQQNGGKMMFFNLKNMLWKNSYIQFSGASGLDSSSGLQFQIYIE
jgi:hypothetical protein